MAGQKVNVRGWKANFIFRERVQIYLWCPICEVHYFVHLATLPRQKNMKNALKADLLKTNSRSFLGGNKTLPSLKDICHTLKRFASIFTCYFWLNMFKGPFDLHSCEKGRNEQWVCMWPCHLCCILCSQTGVKTGLNCKCIYSSFVMLQVR